MHIEISKTQFRKLVKNYIDEHFTLKEFEFLIASLIKQYITWYDSDINKFRIK